MQLSISLIDMLRNDQVYESFSAAAADVTRRRTWDMAAIELEEIVAGLGG